MGIHSSIGGICPVGCGEEGALDSRSRTLSIEKLNDKSCEVRTGESGDLCRIYGEWPEVSHGGDP
ncbi:MAG: hypothetical protein BGO97_03285 [Micrococcales bacterium 70-64]|nr:MAG: hypothetical protein ABT06_03290 [Leifsonia sp. SCN 70-46]OJX84835.1 MAG: hypothetical protein BGO97_03285 [Micrococcales bacterium 70-64]